MEALRQLFPGAADLSWFGFHNGWAPCDETTLIARVRVSFWAPAGLGMKHLVCKVAASFGPCVKVEAGGGGPGGGAMGGGPPRPGDFGGGATGGSGGAGVMALTSSVPNGPRTGTLTGIPPGLVPTTATHPTGPADPNTLGRVVRISEALGLRGPISSGYLLYDEATLAAVLAGPASSIAEVYQAANLNSVATSLEHANTGLNLPLLLEGLLQSVPGGGGLPPGGGVPPPGPPLPPSCGALGIEFVLGIFALQTLLRRLCR